MSYTVAQGDTLSGIASKLGVSLSALEAANPQIANFNRIFPGQSINTPGGGGGGGGGGGFVAPAAPAVTADNAMQDYGPLAQIVQAVPDLQGLLSQAIQNQWTPAHLQASIMATPWYQAHSDTARSLLMTQASDPAAYNQQLANAHALVASIADNMGRFVDENSLAYQYLYNGWTQQQLQNAIGGAGTITPEGAAGSMWGTAGQIQAHLQQSAQAYGVPVTDSYISQWVTKVQSGWDTVDGFDSEMRAKAKAQFPQYAAQIDAGQTMAQIADPYMAQMAKTLEIPQTAITLNDPYIQKALSVRDPQTGAVTSQSMWQFNQTLMNDPRYDRTTQAKTDAYTTLAQIAKDWGFNGGTSGAPAGADMAAAR